MKRSGATYAILGAVLGAGLALPAAAGAGPLAPPAGWAATPELAQRLEPVKRPDLIASAIEAYRAPAGGAMLYVTRVERRAAAADRDRIATAELGELAAALRRQGPAAQALAQAQRADPAARTLEASLTWRDAAAGIVDASRTVVAADAARVVAVTGQCVRAADAPADAAAACEAALATLDPGIAPAARVALALAREAEPDAPAAAGAPAPAPPAPAARPEARPEARLDDASRVELPSRPPGLRDPAAAPAADRRPLYLGAGLVAIALVFWWNRRRRERFEAETGTAPAATAATAATEAASAAGDARDDDADDLHAAARGKERDA